MIIVKKLLSLSPFIFALCIFLLLSSGRIESSDGVSALSVARNMVEKHNFSMAPPSLTFGYQTSVGRDGNYYSPTGLGMSLVYLPSVFLTKFYYTLHGATFPKNFPLEYDFILTFIASFTNPLLGFVLFIVDYKIYDLILKNRRRAFLVSLIISFTTNLLPLAKDAFSHTLFNSMVMASVYFMMRYHIQDKRDRNIILAGIFFGLGAISYNVVFVIIFIFLSGILFNILRMTKKDASFMVKKMMLWFVSVTPFFLIVLVFNYVRFGSVLMTGYNPHTYDLNAKGVLIDGIWGFLFSPGKSIFLYSPILILTLFFSIKYLKKDWSAKLFIILTAILVLFYSQFVFWSGELSWGPRYLSIIIPFAGLVLADHFKEIWKNKILLLFLVCFSMFVQLEGTTIPYDRQYRIYDFGIMSLPKNIQRSNQFEYWNLGEFIPRYSPIYILRKDIVKNFMMLPGIVKPKGSIYFAKYSSLPLKDPTGKRYKNGKSFMYLFTKNSIQFNDIEYIVDATKYPINKFEICTKQNCFMTSQIEQTDKTLVAKFKNPVTIPASTYFFLRMYSNAFSQENFFDIKLYSLRLGSHVISMNDYALANLDTYLLRGTLVDLPNAPRGYYEENNFFRYEVANTVPDLWWLKHIIYFNEPNEISVFLYFILTGSFLSFLGTVIPITSRFKK